MSYSIDDLNGHKLLGIEGCVGSVIREQLFALADLAIAKSKIDHVNGDIMFKSLFCVRVPVYETLMHYFNLYLDNPLPEDVAVVQSFFKLIKDQRRGTPKAGYTPKRALLLLLAHMKRILIDNTCAKTFGFKSPMKVKQLTAQILARAVAEYLPIKFPKSQVHQCTMENAMHHLYDMTNCLAFFDVIIIYFGSTHKDLVVQGKMKGLKLGAFFDALGMVLDYAIGPGSKPDNLVFKETVTGASLVANRQHDPDSLNWPKKLKWRHEQDGFRGRLEECSYYIATDRKMSMLMNTVLRPFLPEYQDGSATEFTSTDSRLYNTRFRTGHNVAEGSFGGLANMFPILLFNNNETDLDFMVNIVQICLHAWNVHKTIMDRMYYNYSPRQRHFSTAHLDRYFVAPKARISENDFPQRMPTWEILTNLWMYFEGPGIQLPPLESFKPLQIVVYDKDDYEYIGRGGEETSPGRRGGEAMSWS